jgi:tripartite-type tricarboxylate transporter receptor subunit TctC
MFQKFRAITSCVALALSSAILPLAAMAQNAYPQKPIRVVVTFRPGGAQMPLFASCRRV